MLEMLRDHYFLVGRFGLMLDYPTAPIVFRD